MTGEVSSVQASVDAGVAEANKTAPVLSQIVIPSPCDDLKAQLV